MSELDEVGKPFDPDDLPIELFSRAGLNEQADAGARLVVLAELVDRIVNEKLAAARLEEWIKAPVHAWPDDGRTYPQEFGAELVKYRNKRISELEKETAR